jgi:hypothetical protein
VLNVSLGTPPGTDIDVYVYDRLHQRITHKLRPEPANAHVDQERMAGSEREVAKALIEGYLTNAPNFDGWHQIDNVTADTLREMVKQLIKLQQETVTDADLQREAYMAADAKLRAAAPAIDTLGTIVACHARDWGAYRRDAIIWGILCGWDDPAWSELKPKLGISDEEATEFDRMYEALQAVVATRPPQRGDTAGKFVGTIVVPEEAYERAVGIVTNTVLKRNHVQAVEHFVVRNVTSCYQNGHLLPCKVLSGGEPEA